MSKRNKTPCSLPLLRRFLRRFASQLKRREVLPFLGALAFAVADFAGFLLPAVTEFVD